MTRSAPAPLSAPDVLALLARLDEQREATLSPARRLPTSRAHAMFSRRTLAATVGAIPLAPCLAALGCVASSARAPTPHAVIAPPPILAAPPASRAPVATAIAPPPPDTAPRASVEPTTPPCTATVRAEVHLRPRGVPQTRGTALPAGTTFEVLGVDPEVRRVIPGDEDEGVLAHVRAVDGATGWTFVRYTEFAPACPILIDAPRWMARTPTTPAERADCSRAPDHGELLWYAERGPRRFRPQILRCCLGPEHWQVIERTDVDGDGVSDEVVRTDRDCFCVAPEAAHDHMYTGDEDGAVVALLRRDGAWLGAEIMSVLSPDRGSHCSSDYVGTLHAGAAVYFRWTFEGSDTTSSCVDLPARVRFDPSHTALSRVDRCGVARHVGVVLPPLAGGCTWTGDADGSVELSCRRPAKRARLRWDEERFELVPDAPAMPHAASDGPLCRYSWE